ncbi:P-loop containing nucleoside triphosphate hydrolase protein [Podospora didyma]|uniref:P-loop containing nucleoside triphosphate hydrolase protein n=1 Tax=Podospora didyma TaxID=330526 RepID=A0AAE0U4E4_9PEZI|nr:P-loop containing nucleoside triphosphate hydrolase protein [Podospora didyma]
MWRRLVAVASANRRPKAWSAHIELKSTQTTQVWLRRLVSSTAAPTPPPPETPGASLGLRLRDYQEECIQTVLKAFDDDHKRIGISLATGSGKTVIFTQLISRVKPLSENATQTLIVAHRRELVEQAARHCLETYPEKTIELELGKLSASGIADITIASIQSITSKDRLLKFDPSRFKLVLVDEAHHIVAPNYRKMLHHLGLAGKQADSPHLVGVSATFSRFDGLRLGSAIDEIVYHKDFVDMIGEQWLSDVIFTTVESTADLRGIKKVSSGELETTALSNAVNTDEINDIIVRAWLAKAAGRRSTLVFCVDLAHVAALTQRFRHYGVDAQFVMGDTPTQERSARLDAFKNGRFPVLVNCGIYTEGTDIPNIDCVLLARPTRSRNLLIQMIGRGMRLHPDKKNCHIIDMVSSLETGITTSPTLFGLDPNELISEASVDDLQKLRDRREKEKARLDSKLELLAHDSLPQSTKKLASRVTFTDYESVFDLIADTSSEKHIRAISHLAWVQVNADRYILPGPTGTFLRIERVGIDSDQPLSKSEFTAWEVRALPPGVSKSPYAAPRQLLKGESLLDVVHGCDNYALKIFPFNFVRRGARWRDTPPSSGQLKLLNKLRDSDNQLQRGEISRGKAADMITKLKHGARGLLSRMQADKRRKEKAATLEQERRGREIVAVGPLGV